MNSKDVKLSKSLSWLLRHGAEEQGLNLNQAGFLSTHTILKLKQFHQYSLEDLLRVVENNDKKRFFTRKNSEGIVEIRANQGHSIKVKETELLTPIQSLQNCPAVVIHGTYLKFWDIIKIQGLSRMNRNHIHFATGLPGDGQVISGMRRNCEIFIYLNVETALADGLQLYQSENGVILCPGDLNGFIKPVYFKQVVKCSQGKLTDLI